MRSTRSARKVPGLPHSPPAVPPSTGQAAKVHASGFTSRDYASNLQEPNAPRLPPKSRSPQPSEDEYFSTIRQAAPPSSVPSHIGAAAATRIPSGPRPINGSPAQASKQSSPRMPTDQQQAYTPVVNGQHAHTEQGSEKALGQEEDEAESILESVVLPVLDSVRPNSLHSETIQGLFCKRLLGVSLMAGRAANCTNSAEQSKKRRKRFLD